MLVLLFFEMLLSTSGELQAQPENGAAPLVDQPEYETFFSAEDSANFGELLVQPEDGTAPLDQPVAGGTMLLLSFFKILLSVAGDETSALVMFLSAPASLPYSPLS